MKQLTKKDLEAKLLQVAQFEQKYGVPIIETMGLTETSSPILSYTLPPGKMKYGSPGIAWGNEVRIVDKPVSYTHLTLPTKRIV